jgi:DNA-directed RNA polymerase subunit RPC12/RpoP
MAIDHEYTPEIVCPNCGHKESNSWEFGSGVNDCGDEICGTCGVEFIWDRVVVVEYCTEIKK